LVREFEIRVTGEARSERNSLILEVRVDRDAYLTIVDVDTEGGVNLLFPNDYQTSSYLANGFVRADALERIPDSLEERNRAGFHWDYAPPEGRDTILVFAATDLAVAETIRSLAKQAREAPEVLGDLRSALVAPAIRGIRVVASDESESIDAGAPSPDWTSASITVDVR
jgi:hypothetical protein